MVKVGTAAEVGKADPIITQLANEDKIPFWKKPNLLYLYLMLFPTCMGIELTSGFDSQMINALQLLESWNECESSRPQVLRLDTDTGGLHLRL